MKKVVVKICISELGKRQATIPRIHGGGGGRGREREKEREKFITQELLW